MISFDVCMRETPRITSTQVIRAALILAAVGICQGELGAQPAAQTAPAPAKRAAAGTLKPELYANLGQLMRGILFPNSNVVFAAQDDDPAKVPPAKDPSLSPN